jgi:hypothetical protein
MTAFATCYIHFDIFMYVNDVIFFLIGSSSMEKHPITDVVAVCQLLKITSVSDDLFYFYLLAGKCHI